MLYINFLDSTWLLFETYKAIYLPINFIVIYKLSVHVVINYIVYIYIHVYMCVWVYIYIYINYIYKCYVPDDVFCAVWFWYIWDFEFPSCSLTQPKYSQPKYQSSWDCICVIFVYFGAFNLGPYVCSNGSAWTTVNTVRPRATTAVMNICANSCALINYYEYVCEWYVCDLNIYYEYMCFDKIHELSCKWIYV